MVGSRRVIALVLVVASASWCLALDTLSYVDPLIGTYGFIEGLIELPPGPQTPFGLVRVGPDTCETQDCVNVASRHNGGYWWGDSNIRTISHLHTVGAGIIDYGTIGVMPMNHIPTSDDLLAFGFHSNFSHATETVEAGYYAVTLETPNVRAELTASDYVGVHRYTFLSDASTEKVILFDTAYTLRTLSGCADASTTIDVKNNEISGWVLEMGELSERFGGFTTYFVATFSSKFTSHGVWDGFMIRPFETTSSGCGREQFNSTGAYVAFSSSIVEVYVGISSISVEQARTNLQQVQNMNFDQVRSQTQELWQDKLNEIEIEGNETNKVKFYTALYHTLLAPTTFSELGGYYMGFDMQVHSLPSSQDRYLSDLSIWDTFRTQGPWLAILEPEIARDTVRSIILQFQQGGSLPKWPLAYGYTGCMVGNHAIILIVDAWKKGITDFDTNAAYTGMKYAATETMEYDTRIDVEDWISLGYIPYDVATKGASLTLDYSYDDWALSTFAQDIGKYEDATMFSLRGKNYKNVWNSEFQFFCPKTKDGVWECPKTEAGWLDPFDWRYTEGDAWHYRFFVPYDVEGLIELFGSNDTYVQQLEIFMEKSQRDPLTAMPNSYFWAGNEHNMASPFLFNNAGRPDLTQKHVRWVLDNRFDTSPGGLPGNEDYGTVSAWFTFAALGFFPMAGSSTYFLSSPLFDKATIHAPSGDITILAYNNSATNIYVEAFYINGVKWASPFFDHSDITGTTTLEFYMSPTPQSL
ncbi:alpha1,2-mannosidase subfamily protein [Pelomyxa schiedti]|nr:alpha1,2-mannosidase subfamily protein [Pelomyxa schiedti]